MMTNNSGFNPQNKFVNEVRTNTKSDLIEITEDKLENILLKHLSKLNKIRGWLTPLSLFITILIVLLTADFKIFIGLGKEIWKAIFVISLLATFIWILVAGIQAIMCSKDSTISFLIGQIKNHQE